ncbi:MAG: pyrroline-5-carboxylate reductase [Granulosicoccaceae bacterium]|jgi:pyrroline-5-carboxylate reductase
MNSGTIAFIGAGNMARAIIGGLIADGADPASIHVADPNPAQRDAVACLGVTLAGDNHAAVAAADTVVLAVKPQVLKQVASDLRDTIQDNQPLVISVAAGIRSADLDKWLGGNVAIVRSMPNTPALVQSGATGLYAGAHVSQSRRDRAESILRAVGLTVWLGDEQQMDAVTALSGSGPAYFFYIIEALEAAGQQLGLDNATARLLAVQTAFGAAKMMLESGEEPATLRERVTSPGGTTERALASLRDGGLETLFEKALTAARDRSVELAKQLGE